MDKKPVYPGAIPLDTDSLQIQRNIEIALGFMLKSALGTGTVVDGLTVTQTASPSMAVLVGPGCILFNTTVDTLGSGFGSLTLDNTNALVKIGVNLLSTTMSVLTAPGTVGQSKNVLVEAQFLEADGSPVVLPYYDAANPAVPYTGPANAGTTNNTARTNTVQLQYKQGTPAATGSQTTPAPDAGWVGIAVITIANGASSIVNSNIIAYPNAPYIPTKLPQLRKRLTGNLNLYVSTTGSDTANDGLTTSTPLATVQKAWNLLIANYDLNGFIATVNIADGTYTAGLNASGRVLGGPDGVSSIIFAATNPGTTCVFTISTGVAAFLASDGAAYTLQGFQIGTPSGGIHGISAGGGGAIAISGLTFAHIDGVGLIATDGGRLNATGNYSITAGGTIHVEAVYQGYVTLNGITVTLAGTPGFTTFAQAGDNGTIKAPGSTFSGSATGTRYSALLNGVIDTQGGGATYFPGNAGGTTATGGQYA